MFQSSPIWDNLAIDAYKVLLKNKSSNPMIYTNLGLAYLRVDDSARAMRAFRKAIRCDRQYADAHYHLGKAHLAEGDGVSAMKHFKKYQSITGDTTDSVVSLLTETLVSESR